MVGSALEEEWPGMWEIGTHSHFKSQINRLLETSYRFLLSWLQYWCIVLPFASFSRRVSDSAMVWCLWVDKFCENGGKSGKGRISPFGRQTPILSTWPCFSLLQSDKVIVVDLLRNATWCVMGCVSCIACGVHVIALSKGTLIRSFSSKTFSSWEWKDFMVVKNRNTSIRIEGFEFVLYLRPKHTVIGSAPTLISIWNDVAENDRLKELPFVVKVECWSFLLGLASKMDVIHVVVLISTRAITFHRRISIPILNMHNDKNTF